jgi:hypothetical protein
VTLAGDNASPAPPTLEPVLGLDCGLLFARDDKPDDDDDVDEAEAGEVTALASRCAPPPAGPPECASAFKLVPDSTRDSGGKPCLYCARRVPLPLRESGGAPAATA